MPRNYTKEQLWKFYEKLPKELQEVVFAPETADTIDAVCQRNEIKDDEQISKVAEQVGDVLLGILPPEGFDQALEKNVNLEKELAKKIADDVNRLVFFPVKESLAVVYKKEAEEIKKALPEKAPAVETPRPVALEESSVEEAPPTSKKQRPIKRIERTPRKTDAYREPTE